MIRSILVPLDGSGLAETALEVAIPLARRLHAKLDTVTVFEPMSSPAHTGGAPVRDTRFENEMRSAASRYVGGLASRLYAMAPGFGASATHREGSVAGEIIKQLVDGGHDLVVMTTHGRTGPSRLWLGSVTDRLIRAAPVPVLLLTETSARGSDEFHDVVIPLDGSKVSEGVIEAAVDLAGPTSSYHLFYAVVPTPLPSPETIDVIEVARGSASPPDLAGATCDAAERYLLRVADRWRARGLRFTTEVRVHTGAANAIMEYARDLGAALIAMSSHGRGAAGRLFLGSVTDRVVRHAGIAVLVRVPPPRRRSHGVVLVGAPGMALAR